MICSMYAWQWFLVYELLSQQLILYVFECFLQTMRENKIDSSHYLQENKSML